MREARVTGEISLQDSAFVRARRDVVDTHDSLRHRRAGLSDEAPALVADGWRGAAADQYARAWADWEQGAELVLRSLNDLTRAMEAAHEVLSASDAEAALRAGCLRGRLEGRP
jgi:WXG100 family type VII secretion target